MAVPGSLFSLTLSLSLSGFKCEAIELGSIFRRADERTILSVFATRAKHSAFFGGVTAFTELGDRLIILQNLLRTFHFHTEQSCFHRANYKTKNQNQKGEQNPLQAFKPSAQNI